MIRLDSYLGAIKGTLALDVLKIFAASLLLVLASQVSFLLPFTPVPLTLQTCALFLIGITLGPVKAALAVLLFLLEGALGLPLFAHGQGGLAVLIGPRGGYLLGFIPAVVISGLFANKGFYQQIFAFLLSNAAIYITGISWLSLWVGSDQALALGLYPFLLSDLFKILATAAFLRGIKEFR